MGFRNGSYASLWEHKPGKGNYEEGRISISRKKGNEFVADFSGFVRFIGNAKDAIKDLPGNESYQIQILECDVSNVYHKESNKVYYHFAIFEAKVIKKLNRASKRDNDANNVDDISDVLGLADEIK